MRRNLLLLGAAAVLAISVGSSLAQDKKTLAIVVKGLDNPFFEQINLGCQKWMSENADSEYECLYTGPASSADEAGEVQIVDDLLTRGVAAIAISPSNAPAMANRCLLISSAHDLHVFHAAYILDRLNLRIAWSSSACCRFISPASYCHFSNAMDS